MRMIVQMHIRTISKASCKPITPVSRHKTCAITSTPALQSDLSLVYNETSEAETMSLAIGLGLLMHPDCWFLSEMEHADKTALITCAACPMC
jgi:hypothetical protein